MAKNGEKGYLMSMKIELQKWLQEDGIGQHQYYFEALPKAPVKSVIKIKSHLILAGLPWFRAVFEELSNQKFDHSSWGEWEGQSFKQGTVLELPMNFRFDVALTGERLALNLLQRASAVATTTRKYVELAGPLGISILDTRKTTPGLRELEKYAVQLGGGRNHRFHQTDQWMIKDNHKKVFGSLKAAWDFFQSVGGPYQNVIVEIHDLIELREAQALGVRYFLLDNFTEEMLLESLKLKGQGQHYEISGGVTLETIQIYLKKGVDAISIGHLTQFPHPIDLSFKFERCE